MKKYAYFAQPYLAVQQVPPQLATRFSKHQTLDNCAPEDLMRKRDERVKSLPEMAT